MVWWLVASIFAAESEFLPVTIENGKRINDGGACGIGAHRYDYYATAQAFRITPEGWGTCEFRPRVVRVDSVTTDDCDVTTYQGTDFTLVDARRSRCGIQTVVVATNYQGRVSVDLPSVWLPGWQSCFAADCLGPPEPFGIQMR